MAQTIHKAAIVQPTPQVAGELQQLLGQKLVAFMVRVDDPKTIGRWASEKHLPRDIDVERRLRDTYQVFRLLLTKESPYTVRAWFVGLNPQLNDESPATAIREGRSRAVFVAARAFLAGG